MTIPSIPVATPVSSSGDPAVDPCLPVGAGVQVASESAAARIIPSTSSVASPAAGCAADDALAASGSVDAAVPDPILRSPADFLLAAREDADRAIEQLDSGDRDGALDTLRQVRAELRVALRLIQMGRGMDDRSAP